MAGCLRNVYSVSCQAVGKIALHVCVCVCVCESSLFLAIDNLKEHSLYYSIMLTEVISEQVNLNFSCLKDSFGESTI